MQFLHDRQRSANSRPHERLDEKKRWSKNKDIELRKKTSSYFTTAQHTLREDSSCRSPSTMSAQKGILLSEDRGGREIYKTPSEVLLPHSTSERPSRPPLHVSGLGGASASQEQHLGAAIGPGRDRESEVTDEFTWSTSVRPTAPSDVSTNGKSFRITGSPCHLFPKVAADEEQINGGGSQDLAADLRDLTHKWHNQDGGLAPEKRKQATRIKNHRIIDYREVHMGQGKAIHGGAVAVEDEQPISDIEGQFKSRIPAWMGSRMGRGTGSEQPVLDSDKLKDQTNPLSATILHNCEIPHIPSPEDNAEDSPTASTPPLERRAKPTVALALSTGAPIGAGPDTQSAALVERPKSWPASAAVKQILPLDPPPTHRGGQQSGGPDCYSLSRVIGLHKGKGNINKRLRPPPPYASRPIATGWAPPPNGWESREGRSNAFHSRSAVQRDLRMQSNAGRNIFREGAPGDSALSSNIGAPREISWPPSCVTVGPAGVGKEELGHCQQSCCYQGNSLVSPDICSLDYIPNNTMDVSFEERNYHDSHARPYCVKPYSPVHGDRGAPQLEYPRTGSPFVEDAFPGIRRTRWDQSQRPRDNSTFRREGELQTHTSALTGMTMGTFWRPHRLY